MSTTHPPTFGWRICRSRFTSEVMYRQTTLRGGTWPAVILRATAVQRGVWCLDVYRGTTQKSPEGRRYFATLSLMSEFVQTVIEEAGGRDPFPRLVAGS